MHQSYSCREIVVRNHLCRSTRRAGPRKTVPDTYCSPARCEKPLPAADRTARLDGPAAGDCQGLDAFYAEVPSDFLLNLEQCLLVFPDPRTPIDDWRNSAFAQAEPNADRMVTIVVTTDTVHRERLVKMSREPANMLVTAGAGT